MKSHLCLLGLWALWLSLVAAIDGNSVVVGQDQTSLSLSLEANDWVKSSLATQRELVYSFRIDKAPLVGTHNSFSSPTYASYFKNQELSITAQLDLGVRWMELDLHYIPALNQSQPGPYRICHGSSTFVTACQFGGWKTCNDNGVVNYGEDTGCAVASPNFVQIFNEIATWLKQYPKNVLVINFDDSMSDADIKLAGNMTATVNGWLGNIFGSSVYTPADLSKDGSWPTINSLISRGKTILMNTNKNTFGGVYVHSDFRGFIWPASRVLYFSGYPSCTSTQYKGPGNVGFGFFQEDLSTITFNGITFYNGPSTVGAFTNASTLGVMRCQFSTFFDFISSSSSQKLVWSWDINQPSSFLCASFKPSTGRWVAEDCDRVVHFSACQSESNPNGWALSSTDSNGSKNTTTCPTGYSFSTPKTAMENQYLMQYLSAAKVTANVWLSVRQSSSGTWSHVA